MSFEVVFTDEAGLQALQIQDWIAERSFEGAIAWQNALRLAVGKMQERGDAFSLAAESPQFSESLFQILFKTRRGLTYRISLVRRRGSWSYCRRLPNVRLAMWSRVSLWSEREP